MPTTDRIGVESAANKAIGGIPIVHYLDILSQGRGQVIRLFCIDAGIAFDDVRYSDDEFSSQKSGAIFEMNPLAKLPIVELNGTILTQSYAILRYFASLLGKYDGVSNEEKHFSDAICDIAIDCMSSNVTAAQTRGVSLADRTLLLGRTRFVDALLSPNSKVELSKYRNTTQANFLRALEKHLASNPLSISGPYVLGDQISYADFVIYQMCHDAELTKKSCEVLKRHPRISELVDAVEERENVKNFLESTKYKG